jgi:hypothetical protein
MKLSFISLIVLFSFSAFASHLDGLLGIYKATDRDGTAVVSKELVRDATLFDPAVYEYKVEVFRKKHDIDRTVFLEITADGKSLVGENSDDCDNNDCHAFNTFEVEVKKIRRGAQVLIHYDGYNTEDGVDEVEEFYGSATFMKK